MRRFAVSPICVRARSLLHTSRPGWGRVIPYLLADIGEGIQKVEVIKVCVKPGDRIEDFEKICEVQSDKATVEITSRYTGVITAVHVSAGETAQVGRPIVDIELNDAHGDNDGAIVGVGRENDAGKDLKTSDSPPPLEAPAVVEKDATGTAASAEVASKAVETAFSSLARVLASPATRHLARHLGVDLTHLKGTGAKGRVLKEDVMAYVGGRSGGTAEDEVVPLNTGIRRVMVATMTEAGTIPSFTACDEVELTKLFSLRELLRDAMAYGDGEAAKLSLMPFFLKAASLALLQYPEINGHVAPDCSSFTVKKAHNIGFAVDTPKGLIVPVLHNVQQKSVVQLVRELNEMIAMGKKNQLHPDCMRGGTFTLSNIGSIGATYATPVIHPPQVAIGALGRVQVLPRFDADGNITKANIMYVSWTADHRVIDGATMVNFGNAFKRFLESPGPLMAEMVKGTC